MEPREKLREITAWLARLPEGAADTLEALRREQQLRQAAVERAQHDLFEIEQQIAMVEEALGLRRWLDDAPVEHRQVTGSPDNGRRPSRGREAVMRLLDGHPPTHEWTIRDTVSKLAELGWAEPDDEHAVSVSLSRLYRSGQVGKVRKGVYSLAAPRIESASSDEAQATDRDRLLTGNVIGKAGGEAS
jgi:hypothetical protein